MARKAAKLKSKKAKAKKPAPKKKAAAKRSVATPGNATPVKELEKLAALYDNCGDRSKTANGQKGEATKIAVEEKHLNAKAFRAVMTERKMGKDDPIKLRDFIDACEYYRDVFGILDMKAADMMQPDKPKRERKQKTEKPTGEMKPLGEVAGNVVNLAGAMADAIEKDKASRQRQPNGGMIA